MVDKVDTVLQGITLIKLQENLQEPVKSVTLKDWNLYSNRVPLYDYTQLIPTAVGNFMITLGIDFNVGASLFINLREYRDIDVGSKLSATLTVSAEFSYGIPRVFEFGLYVRGTAFSVAIYPII